MTVNTQISSVGPACNFRTYSSRCEEPPLYLDVKYTGPHHSSHDRPYMWLTYDQTTLLPFQDRKRGYWDSAVVLAETRRKLNETSNGERVKLLELDISAVASIETELKRYDCPDALHSHRIQAAGPKRFLKALLLNGKHCQVKVDREEVKKGLWFCTFDHSSLDLDVNGNPHLKLDPKGDNLDVVDLGRQDLEDLRYYVKEM